MPSHPKLTAEQKRLAEIDIQSFCRAIAILTMCQEKRKNEEIKRKREVRPLAGRPLTLDPFMRGYEFRIAPSTRGSSHSYAETPILEKWPGQNLSAGRSVSSPPRRYDAMKALSAKYPRLGGIEPRALKYSASVDDATPENEEWAHGFLDSWGIPRSTGTYVGTISAAVNVHAKVKIENAIDDEEGKRRVMALSRRIKWRELIAKANVEVSSFVYLTLEEDYAVPRGVEMKITIEGLEDEDVSG